MHKVHNNNSPNYLAQLFISHQSHYTNSRNNLYVPRPRLDLFKTSISFAGASLWNSLPQNIKSCISVRCFKRNLHRMFRMIHRMAHLIHQLVHMFHRVIHQMFHMIHQMFHMIQLSSIAFLIFLTHEPEVTI